MKDWRFFLFVMFIISGTVLSGLNCVKRESRPVFTQENKLLTANVRPGNSAVLLIEFQKTWTERGFFHWLIKDEYESRGILQNAISVANAARLKGFTVIQAPFVLDKTDKERYDKIPLLPKIMGGFTKGTWKEEFTDGVYEKTDIIVRGRCGFDATMCSDLEKILEDKSIRNVFFCGFTTDHCVGLTIQSLISKGYNSVLIRDCTAARNRNIQREIEENNLTMSSREVIALFGADRRKEK